MTSVPCCLRDVYLRRRTISHKKQEPKLSRKTAEFAYGIAVRKPLNHFYGSGAFSVSKSLAEFAAFAANKIKSILRRGVYTTQNTI